MQRMMRGVAAASMSVHEGVQRGVAAWLAGYRPVPRPVVTSAPTLERVWERSGLFPSQAIQEWLHSGGERLVLCQALVCDCSHQLLSTRSIAVTGHGQPTNSQQNADRLLHCFFLREMAVALSQEVSLLRDFE